MHIAWCAALSLSEVVNFLSICRNMYLQLPRGRDDALRQYSPFWKDSSSECFLSFYRYSLSNTKKKKRKKKERHPEMAPISGDTTPQQGKTKG